MMVYRANDFNADDKILRYPDKLDYFFNGHKTLVIAELDLTNRCNNACPGCCGVNENDAELNRTQIDRVIDSLADIDCRGVILSGGGEPLISPYFGYALERLRLHGIKAGLNSNGLALDEGKIDCILQYCEYFRVSLDAASSTMYRKTHGMPAAAFEKVVENCAAFARRKRELGKWTSFGIGFLTSKETLPEMEGFVVLCKKTGADFAQFRPFTGDFTDISEQYFALKKKHETETFFVKASLQKYREMSGTQARPYAKCRGMFFSTVITADAKVFACLHYRQQKDYFLGDLNHDTLSDIFRSSRMREVYERMDCSACPPFCRDDVFNRTLHTLSQDVAHKEFL
ncbi:MAG: radical SAM protein [Treponematales bacterium]